MKLNKVGLGISTERIIHFQGGNGILNEIEVALDRVQARGTLGSKMGMSMRDKVRESMHGVTVRGKMPSILNRRVTTNIIKPKIIKNKCCEYDQCEDEYQREGEHDQIKFLANV